MILVFTPRWSILDPRRRFEVVMLAMGGWLVWRDPVTIATFNQPGVGRAVGFVNLAAAVVLAVKWVWMAVAPNPALEVSQLSLTVRACSPPTKVVSLADVVGVSSTPQTVSVDLVDGRTITVFASVLRDPSGRSVDSADLRARLTALIRKAGSS